MKYFSLRLYVCTALLLIVSATSPAAPMRFVYPAPENANDQRQTYYWELLRAVLESNRAYYGDYTLEPSPAPMSYQRAQAELERGGDRINIFAPAGNKALESSSLEIPLPLDKGLIGLRLFLIMDGSQAELDKVGTVNDLKRFTIGQRPSWTDTSILQHNGFLVVSTDNFEGLFKGLAANRFDLFARGANEIQAEWLGRRQTIQGLSIEKNLALLYPMSRHYFVPRTNKGMLMAERIRDGLQRLAATGEFERRYQAYKAVVLKDVPLAGRRVFRLQNPELSPLVPPLNDRRWWDDFKAELAPKK